MSRIVYLLGAGASRGKRIGDSMSPTIIKEGENTILEGLPIVAELPERLGYIADMIENIPITNANYYDVNQMNNIKTFLVGQLRTLRQYCMSHATIDTYAKKLYLVRVPDFNFDELKRVLTIFLQIEQLINKPDNRYDTFLANILTSKLEIPNEMSILSWNYDSQFEIAYKQYSQASLPILERVATSLSKPAKIFKLNGSATFVNSPNIDQLYDGAKKLSDYQLAITLSAYANSRVAAMSSGTINGDFMTRLSFAWENAKDDVFMDSVCRTIINAEILVVIGYSFPFFNREIDRRIVSAMPKLKTVYIQDPYASNVQENFKAVLYPNNYQINYELRTNVAQFVLPNEL